MKRSRVFPRRRAPRTDAAQRAELLAAFDRRGLSAADFARTFVHPERGQGRLDSTLAMYAWHCRHHAAHITGLRERMGWK